MCTGVGFVSVGGSKGSRSWPLARMFLTVWKQGEPSARARAVAPRVRGHALVAMEDLDGVRRVADLDLLANQLIRHAVEHQLAAAHAAVRQPRTRSCGGSPRSASTTPPSRRPVPGSASAASSSPIRASAPRSLAGGSTNIVGRKPAPAHQQCAQFSVATNERLTLAANRLRLRLSVAAGVGLPGGRSGGLIGSSPECQNEMDQDGKMVIAFV